MKELTAHKGVDKTPPVPPVYPPIPPIPVVPLPKTYVHDIPPPGPKLPQEILDDMLMEVIRI